MKKTKKTGIKISLLVVFGFSLCVGMLHMYRKNVDNFNVESSSYLISNVNNKNDDWIYYGEILDETAVATLGWDKKTEITLADWKNAPNVIKISDENLTTGHPFLGNTVLESIAIPSRITTIGSFAFSGATSLKTVNFESNSQLKVIDSGAFQASAISSINIPDSVTRINDAAFFKITSLEQVFFSQNSNLMTIGSLTFGATNLETLYIPDSVKNIGFNAFTSIYSLQGSQISMPTSLKAGASSSYYYGFSDEQWDSINWRQVTFLGSVLDKDGVITLGWDNKSSITLEDWKNAPNVTKIGDENSTISNSPFYNSETLKSIIIPSRVKTIGNYAFTNPISPTLESLIFDENSQLVNIGVNAFSGTGITTADLAYSVTSIGDNAFASTRWLNGVLVSMPVLLRGDDFNIPKYGFTQDQWDSILWKQGVFSGSILDKDAIRTLGWGTKTQITLEDWKSAPNVTKIGSENSITSNSPFFRNDILESIVIPSRITMIGNFSFNYSTLTKIDFEQNSNLKTIGNSAFSFSSINAINIPELVESIETDTFTNTSLLSGELVTMTSTLRENSSSPKYGFTQIQWDSIDWKPVKFTGTILTRNDIINIGFDRKTKITLEDWNQWAPNVIEIDGKNSPAFMNNSILQSIVIPAKIKLISGNSNFANTTSLMTISFENNSKLESIGNLTFASSSLTSIDIPHSVTYIADDAFKNNYSLSGNNVSMSISLRGDDFNIPKYGFTQDQWDLIFWKQATFSGSILDKDAITTLGWGTKTQITLEDWKSAPNVTKIGDENSTISNSPFFGNDILEFIVIPSRITVIGNFAFNYSTLTKIDFEQNSNLQIIGNSAFSSSGIDYINIPFSVTSIGNNAFENTIFLDITMPYSLSGEDYLVPKFGFTQEQWNSIVWSDFPKTGMINKIIAKELLRDDSKINWGKISKYDGIKSEAFQNTNITSIEIFSKNDFVIENNAFVDTNYLNVIYMSIQYESEIKNYGFSNEQEMNINWFDREDVFKLSRNSIIIVGSISGVLGLILILNFIIFSKMRKSNINNTPEYDDEFQEQ